MSRALNELTMIAVPERSKISIIFSTIWQRWLGHVVRMEEDFLGGKFFMWALANFDKEGDHVYVGKIRCLYFQLKEPYSEQGRLKFDFCARHEFYFTFSLFLKYIQILLFYGIDVTARNCHWNFNQINIYCPFQCKSLLYIAAYYKESYMSQKRCNRLLRWHVLACDAIWTLLILLGRIILLNGRYM